jgi:hypothetical protein
MSKLIRLTLVYTLIWTGVLATLLAVFNITTQKIYQSAVSNSLAADWSALKGYLKIEQGKLNWYFDSSDPDEAASVSRLRHILVVTDRAGKIMEQSPLAPPVDSTAARDLATGPKLARDRNGRPILLLGGQLWDEGRSQQYYAFIGRPVAGDERLLGAWVLPVLSALAFSFLLCGLMVRHCQSALSKSAELPPAGFVS